MIAGLPVMSGAFQDASSVVLGLLPLDTLGAAGALGGSSTSVTLIVRDSVSAWLWPSSTLTVRESYVDFDS